MKYIGAWQIFTSSIYALIGAAVDRGEINPTDTVWTGPSGDAVIEGNNDDITDDYADYTEAGTVGEYM